MNAESGVKIDVGLMIDEGPWTIFQKLVLCLASLAFIVDSLANNILGISIPAMIGDWHVPRGDFSSVIAMGWIGVAIGTIVAGSLADRFGRKTMLLASILTFGGATAACALVTDIHQLLIFRTIDGFGIGGAIPTATTLLAEFTPARRRSRAVIIGMICVPGGAFLGGIIGSAILPNFGWRWLFAINGAIALIVGVLTLIFLPESPRFLARKPRRHAALLRGLKQLKIDVPVTAQWVDASAPHHLRPLSALFGRGSLMITLGLWGGFFFCFLAAYTSLNWMPSLLSSHGYSLATSSFALSASGIGGMVASVVTAKLIERFGSRIALIFPTLVAILSAVALTQMRLDPTRSTIPVLVAIGALGLALNSLTGLVYALGAYVYPAAVKGTGLGAAGAMGRIGAIMSSYAAVAVLAAGSEAYFGFIAITAIISMVFLISVRKQIPNDKAFDHNESLARRRPVQL